MTDRSLEPQEGGGPPQVDGAREVGAYKLLSVLGDGGMGIVYLAEQHEPVRRRVALKVLKLGMDTEQVVARFETERQALAVMDHPNIARVLDAGVTARGRPFFAMEYVRGTTITDYADTHRLTAKQRLRLFIDTCHAVQHAHQKSVIHRDIKPSNVLVAAGDAGPIVKVIDFGIAKAIGMGLTDRTLFTRVGQMIGTPEYMSPEQAEMSGLDVDTRTDIYSLGVLLYELMVGALPFDLGPRQGYALALALRERAVPRPSTRLTTLGDSLETVALHRGTTPSSLRRTLQGDLDWIILRAMEKDRTRRYETANALAADIERYLADQPVTARPPSAAYRVGKFVQRHRTAVAATAVVSMALVTGAAAATLGLVEARRAQARAERSAATAQEVSDFLVGLFQVSEPGEALGSTITAREVLDRGAQQIRDELSGQPVVQARLMGVMGEVYTRLGLYSSARPLLENGVAVAERSADPREAGLPGLLRRLAVLYRLQGNTAEAESLLRRAADLARSTRAEDPVGFASILNSLGAVYLQLGQYDDATPVMLEALQIQEAALGPESPAVAVTLGNLAALYLYQRDHARAEPYLRRSIAIDEKQFGPDHPAIAESLSNLGALYFMQERYADAEAAYLRAYRIWSRTLEPDHPDIATILTNLGEALWAQQRYAEAEARLTESLAAKERTHGPMSAQLCATLRALANVHRDQGRLEEAELLYQRALRLRELSGESYPSETRETLEDYARLLRLMGRAAEAAALEARAALTTG